MNEALITPRQDAACNPALEFRDGQCVLRTTTVGGTKIDKLISWETVRSIALNIPVDSGWLPNEVVRWGTGPIGDWLVAFVSPGRHALELITGTPGEDEVVERIVTPLPGLVVFGISTKYFVWGVGTTSLDPGRELYRCPLPNVMADASICWGPLKPPQASPRAILKAFGLFIGSSFNNHAASNKSKSQREDIRVLLRELAARGEEANYPVEDLVRQVESESCTLDAAIRIFFQTGEMPE